jgi:hypothetical protein
VIEIQLPIRLGRGLNDRMHWAERARQAKMQRKAAWAEVLSQKGKTKLPIAVTLARISGGELDGDNLQGSFKHIRDGVADAFYIDDRDPRVLWKYEQIKCNRGQFGVRITIEETG